MTSMARFPRKGFTPAFSLIEVVMAIAIVAFALVAIASTLPVGLQSMRDSQNDQAVATIQNQVRGDLQQISYNAGVNPNIYQLAGSTKYYTVEGVPTTVGSPMLVPYYQAQFAVANAAVNGNAYGGTLTAPTTAAIVTVVLTYPYPTLSQTKSFSLFTTKQVGL